MTALKLFSLSVAVTVVTLLVVICVTYPARRLVPTDLKPITGSLSVTSQLKPENIGFLRRRRVNTVVDIRPDGEDSDQTPSSEIERAAKESGMNFHYIPVPHGPIPADAVHKLNEVLTSGVAGRVVLYCRTGNRAVRTYALTEASRPGGQDTDAILAMVRKAGFSADDLQGEINQRIAYRNHEPPLPSPTP